MKFDLNVSIKVRFIVNDQGPQLFNQGSRQFSSEISVLQFLKGIHQRMHRNEIFGTWAIVIHLLWLFSYIQDLTKF